MKQWKNSGIAAGLASGLVFAAPPGIAEEAQCDSGPEDVAVIRALIEDGRLGHEREDPALTAAAYAELATSINRGKINEISRESAKERFTSYYRAVDILESRWLAEPQISLLRGGCNAWSTATMLVRYSYSDSEGETRTARYVFAWAALWEKSADGTWARIMMASTDDGGTIE